MLTCIFSGAAQTVTGSLYYFEYSHPKYKTFSFCVDAGLFQTGSKTDLKDLNSYLPFKANQLQAIILTHGHLDHCGRIPYLVRQGFGGKIYATPVTKQVAEIVMTDAAKIHNEKIDYEESQTWDKEIEALKIELKSKTNFADPKKKPAKGLFDESDVETAVHRFKTFPYHKAFNIHPNLNVEFFDAGHILGSSTVVLTELDSGKKVVFSGDLGNVNKPIIRDPEILTNLTKVEAIFSETTYGDRIHGKQDPKSKLQKIIQKTFKKGGKVLIPAFSVQRSQEIIYLLIQLQRENKLEKVPIFLDSPMSSSILELVFKYPELYDEEMEKAIQTKKHPLSYHTLKVLDSTMESKQLNEFEKPCIIIAGSGMMTGGRILKHLQFHASNSKNTIIISGYQAEGTLGRQILEGQKQVLIDGRKLEIEATVENISEFSAHADKIALKNWILQILQTDKQPILPTKIFLTHGEETSSSSFAIELRQTFHSRINVCNPKLLEKHIILE